jgi:hypothetical protein
VVHAPRHNSDWWMKHDASRMVTRIWFLRLHFFARILHVMPEVEVRSSGTQPWPFDAGSGMLSVTAAPLPSPLGLRTGQCAHPQRSLATLTV